MPTIQEGAELDKPPLGVPQAKISPTQGDLPQLAGDTRPCQAMGTLASWVIQGIASICKISRSFSLIQSKIYIEFTYWAVNTIVFVKMLKHKTQINSLG